jgi:aryl-alcohol dehydrogenase-like predicted oxidoreductase
MRKVRLGKTGYEVTPICLGTWAMGGWLWGGTDFKKSVDAIQAALEAGINFIDTAPAYGAGLAEEMVAEALGGGPKEGVVVATKAGLKQDEDGNPVRTATRDEILTSFEKSIKRLKTDSVDMFFVHWPDFDVPVEETATAVRELHEQGAVKAIGLSNYPLGAMEAFAKYAPVHVVQPPYNLLQREYEWSVFPHCQENDIGVMTYSPLFRGILTGKFSADSKWPQGDHRGFFSEFKGEKYKRNLAAAEALKPIAQRKGVTPGNLAIAWILHQPAVHVAIIGARDARQTRENIQAAEIELTKEDLYEIESAALKARMGITS